MKLTCLVCFTERVLLNVLHWVVFYKVVTMYEKNLGETKEGFKTGPFYGNESKSSSKWKKYRILSISNITNWLSPAFLYPLIKTMEMDFSHENRCSIRGFLLFHCLCTFLVDLCSSCMHITHQTHDDSFTMRTNIRSPAYLRLLLECTGISITFFVTFHKQNVN